MRDREWNNELEMGHHSKASRMGADFRERTPGNLVDDIFAAENEEVVDSEWADFEKLLR